MLFSIYTIKDNITKLKSLQGQIKPTAKIEELATYQNKFYGFTYDLILGLGEAHFTIRNSVFDRLYEDVIQEIVKAQNAKSIEEFKNVVDTILLKFEDFKYDDWSEEDFSSNTDDFTRSLYYKRQYVLTDYRALTIVAKHIKTAINRDVTLFAPDCSDSENITAFNLTYDRLFAYGNEANEVLLKKAKEKMHKVVKGGLKGSRIQNNAFDILYVQPQLLYDFDSNDFLLNKRIEKSYISDIFKYVRHEGVVVITIPCTRLFKDLCSMLAKQLKNIQVFKANRYDFDTIGMIHIVGQKDTSKEVRRDEYAKLRRLYDYNSVVEICDIEEFEYALPRTNVVIETFKGSALDLDEIEFIVDNSTLMDKMWNSQKVDKLDENIKNPLLPFNIGQLGLVLTSGCLDGVVDEGDGFKHLIKGRVSKQIIETESETEKGVEVTETTVNRVEINVLLPNGEFKVLA